MSGKQSSNNKKLAYAAAHFALELDGHKGAGLFRTIEGGSLRADVMTYQYGHSHEKWRQLGKPKFEDIKAQIGMAMSKPFYDWVSKFFAGEGVQKNGAILAGDFHYAERARREFTGAMIKELTFPALTANGNQPLLLGVTIAVEGMKFAPGTGSKIINSVGMGAQKEWAGHRFELQLDGFNDCVKHCHKIDTFTIKQNIMEYHSGGFRDPIKVGSVIDFPNLTFYIPESDAGPLFDAAKKKIVDGDMKDHNDKKAGSITLKSQQNATLMSLEFYDAEIVSVTPDKSDASGEEIKGVKVELYTERMEIFYPAGDVE
jgi:phage tail-like protein